MSAALNLRDDSPGPRVEAAAFVLALRGRGIFDLPVLRAMETVPRELFAPRRYLDLSRQDVALPLAFGQTMTAPATVALMLAALAVRPGDRVLEVGTGSGYVAALLAAMGALVHSAERHPVLAEGARHRLRAAGFAQSCEVACRDGLGGDLGEARFDRILLNGSVPALSATLTSRLAPGGRLVLGHEADRGATSLVVLSREPDGQLASRVGASLRLSRLVVDAIEDPAAPATEV